MSEKSHAKSKFAERLEKLVSLFVRAPTLPYQQIGLHVGKADEDGGSAETTPTSSLEASQESTVSTDKNEGSAVAALSSSPEEAEDQPSVAAPEAPKDDASWHSGLRNEDMKLLQFLSVNQICDLMLEKKKEKYYMKLSSSEKVDKFRRYRDFTIFQLPFPGCEFYEAYSRSDYKPQRLLFDWSQTWDLRTLTKNYVKVLLTTIANSDSGLLVHCISGWDRTPTFISMIRLSLWADDRIHQSLSPLEMAYLSVAYDWFLFSHDLKDRLSKKQEIFHFCYHMLKYISNEEFSMATLEHPKKDVQSQHASPPEEPVTNGASTLAMAIPVITSSPPADDLFFSCTSIPSGSPAEGVCGDECPSTGPDGE
ncbi:hypothetical protein MTO96_035149 [Rhipicephalus appendiculatus]